MLEQENTEYFLSWYRTEVFNYQQILIQHNFVLEEESTWLDRYAKNVKDDSSQREFQQCNYSLMDWVGLLSS